MKGFFVAATGQNVGKTTTCLGLVYGLRKRHKSVGYMKPVGQESVETENQTRVDKDVLLFRTHFKMNDPYEEMSPVLFPRGFTRDYLDGKVEHDELVKKISKSYTSISARYPMTVIEGTGHTAVGSIVNLNNAQVAKQLGVPIILVGSGGLGSSFDELELNKSQCEKEGVRVAGVILNRVLDDKRDMIIEYVNKALSRWNIPLLGAIPYDAFLTTPTMSDYEQLFKTKLLTGEQYRWRHFEHMRLAASPVETYRNTIHERGLVITPAGREDIILATLTRHWEFKIEKKDLQTGLILTGPVPPNPKIIEQLREADIPTLYAPLSSYIAMTMVASNTSKIRSEDTLKIEEAVNVVESHIDFDLLTEALKK